MGKTHTELRQVGKYVAFCKGRKVMSGITQLMQERFFPRYSFGGARLPDGMAEPVHVKPPPGTTPMTGLQTGILVDEQLSAIVKTMKRYRNMTVHIFLKGKDPTGRTVALPDDLFALREKMHRFTRNILTLLMRKRWEPVDAQVPCSDYRRGISTAVDLVCADPEHPRARILVEIKCGFQTYAYKYCGMMRAPFHQINDCPANQFQVQLALTRGLYIREYPRHLLSPIAAVILANDHTTSTFRLKKRLMTAAASEGLARLAPSKPAPAPASASASAGAKRPRSVAPRRIRK